MVPQLPEPGKTADWFESEGRNRKNCRRKIKKRGFYRSILATPTQNQPNCCAFCSKLAIWVKSLRRVFSFSSIFPQRKNRNAYTFRFPAERETGFEPATPTLARLYSTPEPLAHFLIFILLSARCTLQMIIYTNAPYLSTVFLNFFKKLKNIHDLHISHLFQSATTTSHRSATGRYRPPSRPQSQTLGVIPPSSLQNRAQHILII